MGHSARTANVSARLILPYLEGISSRALCVVRAVGWEPHLVPRIPPPHNGKDVYYRFQDQYTKLNIWSFDKLGIKRLVYLDADTLVLRHFNELFSSPFNFAAVQDVYGVSSSRGFSVMFNAGVLAIQTSTAVFEDMKQKIETAKFPLGEAEQAFLNLYFGSKVLNLPYVYNANLAIKARSPALWEAMKDELRIVHYTTHKPLFQGDGVPGEILTPEEQMEAIRLAAQRDNGMYAEEIGWWREAYERMRRDKWNEIADCLRVDS
jgi:inositol phosphorylceramide glucuronosyltransferase 1